MIHAFCDQRSTVEEALPTPGLISLPLCAFLVGEWSGAFRPNPGTLLTVRRNRAQRNKSNVLFNFSDSMIHIYGIKDTLGINTIIT